MNEDKAHCFLCGAPLSGEWCKDLFGFYYCWKCYWDTDPIAREEKLEEAE